MRLLDRASLRWGSLKQFRLWRSDQMDFPRYADWSPTQFDGNIDIDREDWLVMPVMQTRDSGCIAQSNFATFLKELGGESETVEVHRFGHWGPGWFEIIIIDPSDAKAFDTAYDCARALQDYPVLSDEDLSERESELEQESWSSWACRDFRRECEKELESYMNEFHGDPVDSYQRWCKNWGLDVELCGCGDCILCVEEWMADLIAKLDTVDDEGLRGFATNILDMEVSHTDEGAHFRWKMDTVELIEWLDGVKV